MVHNLRFSGAQCSLVVHKAALRRYHSLRKVDLQPWSCTLFKKMPARHPQNIMDIHLILYSFRNITFLKIPRNIARYLVWTNSTQWMYAVRPTRLNKQMDGRYHMYYCGTANIRVQEIFADFANIFCMWILAFYSRGHGLFGNHHWKAQKLLYLKIRKIFLSRNCLCPNSRKFHLAKFSCFTVSLCYAIMIVYK